MDQMNVSPAVKGKVLTLISAALLLSIPLGTVAKAQAASPDWLLGGWDYSQTFTSPMGTQIRSGWPVTAEKVGNVIMLKKASDSDFNGDLRVTVRASGTLKWEIYNGPPPPQGGCGNDGWQPAEVTVSSDRTTIKATSQSLMIPQCRPSGSLARMWVHD